MPAPWSKADKERIAASIIEESAAVLTALNQANQVGIAAARYEESSEATAVQNKWRRWLQAD